MKTLYLLSDDPVVVFAAQEFARYARKMASKRLSVKRATQYEPAQPGVWLGIGPDFAGAADPSLAPSRWDDGFQLKQTGDQLLIAGANARSVLFGVYAYFERLGARYVRPGPRGEHLPRLAAWPPQPFDLTERAAYRHRGVCIEGAPSVDHALGLIDWMARKRMNAFFLQFRHGGTFWDRWYAREYNPHFGQPRALTDEECYAMDDQVIAAAKQRGMMVHRVGHGWTAAAVGLRPFGWQTTDEQVAPDKQRWLAELNGRRDLFQKIPINTELCYSHPPAFEGLLDEVMRYAGAHPEVDVLHFWLSDATNNKCECAECAALSPADWYARLVNALSERLYQLDPARRFVFLSYFESWWAPEQTVIETKRGNAIFMFAPIARCFRHTLADDTCASDFPAQRPPLNQVSMPRDNHSYQRFLQDWWKVFSGDSFLFDYHLIWPVHAQLSDVELGRVLHQDMRDLRGLGLNGMVSCQVLRVFWPTGLPMTAMAEALWDAGSDWEQVKRDYFAAAYGEDAAWVETYLAGLEGVLYDLPAHEKPILNAQQPERARAICDYLDRHADELTARHKRATGPVYRESLALLVHHLQCLKRLAGIVTGDQESAAARDWLLRSERRVHPFLDVPFLLGQHKHLIDSK